MNQLQKASEALAAKRLEAEAKGLIGIPFANYCADEAAAYRAQMYADMAFIAQLPPMLRKQVAL